MERERLGLPPGPPHGSMDPNEQMVIIDCMSNVIIIIIYLSLFGYYGNRPSMMLHVIT